MPKNMDQNINPLNNWSVNSSSERLLDFEAINILMQDDLRENDLRVLSYIYRHGGEVRTSDLIKEEALAELNLSKQTVINILKRLEKQGYLKNEVKRKGDKGPPTSTWELTGKAKKLLGFGDMIFSRLFQILLHNLYNTRNTHTRYAQNLILAFDLSAVTRKNSSASIGLKDFKIEGEKRLLDRKFLTISKHDLCTLYDLFNDVKMRYKLTSNISHLIIELLRPKLFLTLKDIIDVYMQTVKQVRKKQDKSETT